MAEKEFTNETRKKLVDLHEQRLFRTVDADARFLALALAGYGERPYLVLDEQINKFRDDETPKDFIRRTYFKEVCKACIPSKSDRQKYELVIEKSNQFQYALNYQRRSVRSQSYVFSMSRNLHLMHDYYLFSIFHCSLSRYLRDELTDELLDLKRASSSYYGFAAINNLDMMIAAELDWDMQNGGPGELQKTIEEIILGENNTSAVTVPIIRGILKSDVHELHELLGKLLLAARLQEGVRQAICENADCGTTDSFITIFSVITKNNLIRFSSVKRAVATWIGIFNQDAAERISQKTVDLMEKCLGDKNEVSKMLKSENAMELITALWTLGFYSAESALMAVKTIIMAGNRNQLLVAAYYNRALYTRKLYSQSAEYVVETHGDDLELVAAFLPTYLDNFNTYNIVWYREDHPSQSYFPSDYDEPPEKWFDGDVKKARIHAGILYNLFQKLGKGKAPKVFEHCAFPWNNVSISKMDIAMRLCVMAVIIPGSVQKDVAYEMIENAEGLGATVMKRLLRPQSDKDDRNFIVHALSNNYLRHNAGKMLEDISISDDECMYIESLLRYKNEELRSIATNLIAERKDKNFSLSIKRLLAGKSEGERFSGLNFVSRLKREDESLGHAGVDWSEFKEDVAAIKNPTQKEELLIKSLLEEKDNDEESEDYAPSVESLYAESDISRISLSEINLDTSLIEQIADCDKKELISILEEFDRLMLSHRDDQYQDFEGNDHRLGEKELFKYDKGGNIHPVTGNRYSVPRKVEMLPFPELWTDFYKGHIKSPVVLIQLFVLRFLHNQKNGFLSSFLKKSDSELESPKIISVENILFGKLCKVNPGEYEYFLQDENMFMHTAFHTVIQHLIGSFCDIDFFKKIRRSLYCKILRDVPADYLWYPMKSSEKNIEKFTLEYVSAFKALLGLLNGYINLEKEEEKSDDEFAKWFKLNYALALHADYAERTKGPDRMGQVYNHDNDDLNNLSPEDYFRAYKLGLINLDSVYYGIIKINTVRKSLSHKPFIFSADDEFFKIYMKIHDTIIQNELRRGDEDSSCSDFVSSLRVVYGADNVLRLIQGLGSTPFERGLVVTIQNNIYYYYRIHMGRTYNFSHLIAASRPSKDDSAERMRELVAKYKIPEQKLFDLAMYNTNWIPILSDVLSVPRLESGCYYFIAHMKESWGDNRDKSRIAKFTPLTVEELGRGAFDLDWFTEIYAELGEEIFDKLYQSAKYITDGARHTRARKFADAALGRVTEDELEAEIKRARNKDLVMSYPLIPILEKGDDFNERILHRYEFLQEFKKESKQFGAQRRQSEGEAVEIALENLSRSAGYSDVNRLNLNMESALIDKVREVFEWQKITGEKGEAYEIRVAVSDEGKPSVECRKEASDKILKSVPASLKKIERCGYIQDVHKRLRQQHERTRSMFENFMTEQILIPANEIVMLLKNPVVSPIVSALVFIDENKNTGFISEEKGKILLADWDGSKKSVSKEDSLRVAHAYDFYIGKKWHEWQKAIFENKTVQPFKQVFRELYVKLDEELEKDRSLMFAGNQIQPRKAVAALKSRRWIADYESGLQKVFYKQNLIAEIYAQADWFSPADIECPSIEYIAFYPRRYDEKKNNVVKIRDMDCILYSEIMRDVDLAVSVAHAGSVDPETSHSTIEMRRAVCEFTLPLFKIDSVRFEKNFAFIKGSRAEYSVHLGTGLVHKTAGGAINIVAVHSQQRGKLFLPFVDEDPKTAEVLTKILMLARDEKIRDPYILDQINAGV